jgi:hypothetical protein
LLGTGTSGDPGLLSLYENDLVPVLDRIQQQSTANQRARDITDVEMYGQRAVAAVRGADPNQQRLVERLNADAMSGLSAGTGLTPDEMRLAQQATRQGQSDRGLGFGPSDVFAETLATDRYGRQRQQQRQDFGLKVAGVNAATAPDAMQIITGRSSGLGAASGLFGQIQGQNANNGAQVFDPFSAYGSDVANTNYNGRAAAKIAEGNANSALIGAGISAAGSVGSSL